MTSWLIIRTPTGVHCWPLPDGDPAQQLLAARASVGFPADDAWATGESRWDLQITHGQPHPRLLAGATVHQADELAAVQPGDYGTRLAAARETARCAEARARWDALPAATKAEVLAGLTPPAAPVKGAR